MRLLLVMEIPDATTEAEAQKALDAFREANAGTEVGEAMTLSRATCQDIRDANVPAQVPMFGLVPEKFIRAW